MLLPYFGPRLCGPFTLFRNTPRLATLYRSAPLFARVFMEPEPYDGLFDENGMSDHVLAQADVRTVLNIGQQGWPARKGKYYYEDGRIMRKWRLKDVKSGHLIPRATECAFFHLHEWKTIWYDFDPRTVRGWTIVSDQLRPIR